MAARNKEPLRTLELMVGAIVVLMAIAAPATVIGVIGGWGSAPGVNAGVCVAAAVSDDVAFRYGQAPPALGPVDLRDGVRWHAEEVQLCDPEPDLATRALAGLGLTVWVLLPMLFFGLLWRMLRQARREGVFTDRVPEALGRLGGLLLAWAALDFVVNGVVNAALLSRMTDELIMFSSNTFPWVQVLLGIALLALARVMGEAVRMRQDVEATI